MTTPSPIAIRTDVLQRAERNARTLGLSVSDYLSRLVLNDTHPARKPLAIFPVEQGWGPVPKAVNERWDKEIAQAEAAYRQGKQKGYHTAVDRARPAIDKLASRAKLANLYDSLTVATSDVLLWDWSENRFDLIVAITLLDHLLPEEIPVIVRKMLCSAKMNCTFYVEVHTVDDPAITGEGTISEFASEIKHYYGYNELLNLFSPYLRIVLYNERIEWDYDHGEPHTHGFATLIGILLDKEAN